MNIKVGDSNDLSMGQIALIERLRLNPVVAAEVLLGVKLHWYQVLALEDFFLNNKRFALLKWSRQLGKCVVGKSLILIKLKRFSVNNTEIKNIELYKLYDIINNDKDIKKIEILTLNQDINKFEWTDNFIITYNGNKKAYKVKTALGKEVCLTENHPLKKLDKWVEVKDIKIKDKIAIPRIVDVFNDIDTIEDFDVIMLAYMIGDGCVRNYNQTLKSKGTQVFIDKRVPSQIIGTSKRQVALFLSRLFATDGWASINNQKANNYYSKDRQAVSIGYCSSNRDLAKDVQHLLLRFSIISKLSDRTIEYIKKDGTKALAYQLSIVDSRSVLTFCDEIGIYGKEEAVSKCRELAASKKNNNNRDIIPIEIWGYIREKVSCKLAIDKKIQIEWLKESGYKIDRNERVSLRNWDRKGLISRKELTPKYSYAPQRDKVLKYAEFLNDDYLRSLANSDLYWDEVVSIESIGDHDTYDLAVPGPDNGDKDGKYRNFICDDILVHNTFLESIIVALQCILYPDEVGVFLAPSQRQSFNPMNNLLRCYNNSEIMRSLVIKKTKGIMKFKNGSEITSLPMGDGSKILGTHATIVGIDEYARFTKEYITTIILPMLNQPGANGLPNKLITLSTPLSKQNHFYQWYLTHKKHMSKKNSLYHLSEYDYRDSPTIDLNIIQMSKENSSWEQFARENLGIFTDNINGFFSNELIYMCVEQAEAGEEDSIKIENVPEDNNSKYVLGVDPSNMVMEDRFAIYLYKVIENENSLGLQFANAWTFDSETIPKIEELIMRIMIVFPILQCNIDSGGGGRQIAEHLMEPITYRDGILNEEINWTGCKNAQIDDKTPQRGGNETPIRIIPYSSDKKNRMFFNLKNLMTKGLFKIPKNNLFDKSYIEPNLLKDELENIVTRTLPNNLLTFDHPGGVGDDRVNATVLAVDAFWDVFYGQTQSSATMVRGVENRRPKDMFDGDGVGQPRDIVYTERELKF